MCVYYMQRSTDVFARQQLLDLFAALPARYGCHRSRQSSRRTQAKHCTGVWVDANMFCRHAGPNCRLGPPTH